MKRPELTIEQYQILEDGYKNWLTVLGYSPVSISFMVNAIRYFLCYLEANNIFSLETLIGKISKITTII